MENFGESDHIWMVFEHEANSFKFTYDAFRSREHRLLDGTLLKNALLESGLLHLRQLAEILLSLGRPDDIKLDDLTAGFKPSRLNELAHAYGSSTAEDPPRWVLNKMLVHPSKCRKSSYDYSGILDR